MGSSVMGFSLVWPQEQKTHSVGVWCGLWSLWALVGSAVRVRFFIWPKDPRCRCLVEFRRFEGACGLHGEGVVPCMA